MKMIDAERKQRRAIFCHAERFGKSGTFFGSFLFCYRKEMNTRANQEIKRNLSNKKYITKRLQITNYLQKSSFKQHNEPYLF